MRFIHKKWLRQPYVSLEIQRYMPVALTVFVFALSVLGIAIFVSPADNSRALSSSCSPNGYIVKDISGGGGDTDVLAIDMVTGQGSSAGQVVGSQLNAIGFNPKDDKFYAWDLQNQKLVRVNSDFSGTPTPLTIINYPVGAPTTNIFSGDVDVDGHYWFFAGNKWYEIDLNTPSPTYIGEGTFSGITGTNGTDWAFMPGTDHLYRAMDEGGIVKIWKFERSSKTWTFVRDTNIASATDGDMGAVYADPNMNFYMSSHISGKLFKVDLTDVSNPFEAVELDASDPNSNDGARCALAPVPTDFGDAPSSYMTSIDDDGPRHGVINFNASVSTAPLMLGKYVDIEDDGFSSVNADGDDNDHTSSNTFVDDERGVTHIIATPGSTDPLTVPVYVTNTSSQGAVLVGWIDLDNDGVFESGERVSTSVAGGFTGYKQLTFPAPSIPYSTNTYARFRLFSANDTSTAATSLLPTGPASGGEVEDVLVQVGSYTVNKTSDPADGVAVDRGQVITYSLALKNTGATVLNNLKVQDDLADVLDDAELEGSPTISPSGAGSVGVTGTTLDFTGDISVGETVTVTYKVKVRSNGTLGNSALHNVVLAANSNCHPVVQGQIAVANDPSCSTDHPINAALAATGSSVIMLLGVAGSLLGVSIFIVYIGKQRLSALRV